MGALARAFVIVQVTSVLLILRMCGVSEADIRRLVEARIPDYARIERLERELFEESAE